jgi:heavy metal translocating P-type ATPase
VNLLNSAKLALLLVAAAGLICGLVAPFLGLAVLQHSIWGWTAGLVLIFLLKDIVTSLSRSEFGLDLVAAMSLSAAIYFGETLAASIVALMYSGGQLLEDFATTRARSEMRALLSRTPKTALRHVDGQLLEVGVETIVPGDLVFVRQGDTIPVDGKLKSDRALLDTSMLTGESIPVLCKTDDEVSSGSLCLDMAFVMQAIRPASESTYAGIVRLVEAAQNAKAPMVRLADRFALWFLAFTVILASVAWMTSIDHNRMLAVLVSATPCPLILAVPIAIISGISRAARRGVLLKGGPVLEALARTSVLVIDKTGTLTLGRASLRDIKANARHKPEDLLRFAASLDQASVHVIAASLVEAAHARGIILSTPSEVSETAGSGIEGYVENRKIVVGGQDFVRQKLNLRSLRQSVPATGSAVVAIGIDGRFAGELILADEVRSDAELALQHLREVGVRRIVLASGDRREVVTAIGSKLSLDALHSELGPNEKVALVLAEKKNGVVLMAGDGVNDAPALAAADIGISMGARGSPASAEAADAVLLVDNLLRIAEAIAISQRSIKIALQSVYVGLGLSAAAMAAAALGYLPVIQGAIFQEIIDVAVILNALRALR